MLKWVSKISQNRTAALTILKSGSSRADLRSSRLPNMGIPFGPGGKRHSFPGGGRRLPTGTNISLITKNVVDMQTAMVNSSAVPG